MSLDGVNKCTTLALIRSFYHFSLPNSQTIGLKFHHGHDHNGQNHFQPLKKCKGVHAMEENITFNDKHYTRNNKQ